MSGMRASSSSSIIITSSRTVMVIVPARLRTLTSVAAHRGTEGTTWAISQVRDLLPNLSMLPPSNTRTQGTGPSILTHLPVPIPKRRGKAALMEATASLPLQWP